MNTIEHKMHQWLSPVRETLPDLYLVGGAVRDFMLNRKIVDIDIACEKPAETANLLGQYHDATVVLFDKKKNAECYRVVARNNTENVLDIVQLRKNSIFEDLLERDFTFNSIAIPIDRDGRMKEMIDPLHGAEDIQNRQIRMSSINAFQSDPVRILRAFRFSAELDFKLEALTAKMLQNQIHLISRVAIERIMSELVKLFKTGCSAQHIRRMDELGLLGFIFPEINKLKGCVQNDYHHLDVWDHSMLVLENCEKIILNLNHFFPESATQIQKHLEMNNHLALTKLAALLHDIGKPDTRKTDEQSNRVIFHGHDQTGRDIISHLSKRIKLSAKDRSFLETMVGNHMHFLFLSRPDVKEKTIFKWFRKSGDDSVSLIIIAMADRKSTLGPASDKTALDHHPAWSKNLMKKYFYEIRHQLEQVSLINGKDLLALGMSPGPELGQILTAIREAQDLGTIRNYDEGLALAKKMIQNRKSF